jgi:hypothetical protein
MRFPDTAHLRSGVLHAGGYLGHPGRFFVEGQVALCEITCVAGSGSRKVCEKRTGKDPAVTDVNANKDKLGDATSQGLLERVKGHDPVA